MFWDEERAEHPVFHARDASKINEVQDRPKGTQKGVIINRNDLSTPYA